MTPGLSPKLFGVRNDRGIHTHKEVNSANCPTIFCLLRRQVFTMLMFITLITLFSTTLNATDNTRLLEYNTGSTRLQQCALGRHVFHTFIIFHENIDSFLFLSRTVSLPIRLRPFKPLNTPVSSWSHCFSAAKPYSCVCLS